MTVKQLHPLKSWRWFGHAGHFICAQWCRFHLTTQVGPWLVSTVGLFVHPRHSNGSERGEAKWLAENPNGEEIGLDRFYETMVFRAGAPCTVEGCGCGLPKISGHEVDFSGYNDAKAATEGHYALCEKWAALDHEADVSDIARGLPR